MDERQDLYSGRSIEWRWVLVGTLIVLGMESFLGALGASLGMEITSVGVFVVVTTVAFALGGVVIGVMSPGYTAWEAGYASLIAALGIVFLAIRLLDFAGGLTALLPVALLWGLLCGLAGGWIGERFQRSAS